MTDKAAILLLVEDQSVLSALRFSLSIEGFTIAAEAGKEVDLATAATLVIDDRYRGDGIAALEDLRTRGCTTPAIILSTNPSARQRTRTLALGASLIEKPLLGDELSSAIRAAHMRKAA